MLELRCERVVEPKLSAPIRIRLSPVTERVLALIEKLTTQDAEMPANTVVAEMLAPCSRQTVAHAILSLSHAALIRVEVRPAERRIIDTRSGRATRWGPFVIGHAPGSAQGQPRKRVRRAPAGTAVALEASGLATATGLPIIPFPPLGLRPTSTCQWPLWAHGSRPDGRLCGEPTKSGAVLSFCREHYEQSVEKKTAPTD